MPTWRAGAGRKFGEEYLAALKELAAKEGLNIG